MAVWRQFVDGPIAIGGGERLDPFGRVVGKILGSHHTAMTFNGLEHAFGDFAFVIGIFSVIGDLLKRPGEVRIVKELAGFRRPIVREIDLGSFLIAAKIIRGTAPIRRDPFRNRVAILCGMYGRGQVFGKFFASLRPRRER